MSRFEEILQMNRIASQIHRFWTFYEAPLRIYEFQLDLFAPNFVLISPRGSIERSQYEASTEAGIPKDLSNAHRLRSIEILGESNNAVHAQITLDYQGKTTEKTFRTTNQYDVWFERYGGVLPKLDKLELHVLSRTETNEPFQEAWMENRALSVVRAWAAAFDLNDGDSAIFKNFASPDLEFRSSTGTQFKSLDEFSQWFSGLPSQVRKSIHVPEAVKVSTGDRKHEIELNFEFHWEGVLANGAEGTMRTAHQWILLDDSTRPYPTIKSIKETQIQPFQP